MAREQYKAKPNVRHIQIFKRGYILNLYTADRLIRASIEMKRNFNLHASIDSEKSRKGDVSELHTKSIFYIIEVFFESKDGDDNKKN